MMFSGIVKEVGIVENLQQQRGILEITISSDSKFSVGSSVSVDGCCLTVVEKKNSFFKTEITEETLNKTNFKNLRVGSKVNLEPSLVLGDKLDGHLVLGHVDSTGEINDILISSENRIVKISFPAMLKHFIAPKGSISVNGVSLTVIGLKNNVFSFTLIPYTRDNTNLGLLKPGDLVNLEVDLISRYLINYLETKEKIYAA